MRRCFALICLIILTGLLINACAKPAYVRVDQRPAFSEVKTNNGKYPRTMAVVPVTVEDTLLARHTQDLFLQQVVAAIREESGPLVLLLPDDSGMPAYLKTPGLLDQASDVFTLCQKARLDNVQYLVRAQLLNIATEERKTGIWWFRKTRYFVDADVALDIYNTTTGAKLFSKAQTAESKVDVADYESLQSGTPYEIPRLNDIVADMAQELGEAVAEAIQDSRWMTPVRDVRANQIILSVDKADEVNTGDRFVIFEGRQIVSGPDGGKYIVPGYELTEGTVIAVESQKVVVAPEGRVSIQPGDIACPAE